MKIEEIKEKIKELKKEIQEADGRTIRIIERAEKKGYTESQGFIDDVNTIRGLLLRSPEIRKYFESKRGEVNSKTPVIEDELTGVSCLIYLEYIEKLIQWKENKKRGKEVPFPELEDFLKQKIVDLTEKAKEIEKYEGKGERIKSAYREEEKDFIEEAYISADVSTPIRTKLGWKAKPTTLPPPSSEEGYDNLVINYIAQKTSKLEKILFEDEKEHFVRQFQMLRNCKSSYQIAKEKGVNWRRLSYTLKSINFPIFKIGVGRYSNLVPKTLFEKDSSLIKLIKISWKLEDNYRKWIGLLKKEGRNKSTISCFMKRKIDRGIVPSYYFDIVPPSPKYLSYLKSRKKEPIELPKGIWKEEDDKFLTHKEIMKSLKGYFSKIK
jgi:hypothetical protein